MPFQIDNDVIEEIRRLKKEKNAVVLAHNYQLPEIQEAADYVGDSLGLARKAKDFKGGIIVMCGVYFMAETAAVLNPGRAVIIPDRDALCPLAAFADKKMILEWRKKYPDHAFVAYVNTTAEVKAEADVCCTSANAVEIVRKVPQSKIVFLPDKNLGSYVREIVTEKEIVLWPGYCIVHEASDPEAVGKTIEANPGAAVLAHPECPPEIRKMADAVLSTGQMFDYVDKHPEIRDFIVVTEWGINYGLHKKFPGRNFIEPLSRMECRNMKKITAGKLLECLRTMKYRVEVDPETAEKSARAIEKMLDLMQ
ncbi:MAG: quinolinate synthase NadA [Brevinematales bacterium]